MIKKIMFSAILILIGSYQAWSYFTLAKNTYVYDYRNCADMYKYFASTVVGGKSEEMKSAINRLNATMYVELESANNPLKDSYLKDQSTMLFVNANLKLACDTEPSEKFSSIVEKVAASVRAP
jgi:hypothetical protein